MYLRIYGVFKLTKMYLPDVYSSPVHVLRVYMKSFICTFMCGYLTVRRNRNHKKSISVSSITSMSSVYIGKGKERGQGMSESPPVFS